MAIVLERLCESNDRNLISTFVAKFTKWFFGLVQMAITKKKQPMRLSVYSTFLKVRFGDTICIHACVLLNPHSLFFFKQAKSDNAFSRLDAVIVFLTHKSDGMYTARTGNKPRDFALAPSAGLTKTGFVQLSTGALNTYLFSQSADYRRHCQVFEHNYRTLRESGDYRLVWDWAGEVVAGNYPDTPSQTTTEPPSKRSRIRIAAAPKWFAGSVETDGVSVHALFVSPESTPNDEGDRKKLGAQKADEEVESVKVCPIRRIAHSLPHHKSLT